MSVFFSIYNYPIQYIKRKEKRPTTEWSNINFKELYGVRAFAFHAERVST